RTVQIPFAASNFSSPQDNVYLPMSIGRTYVYKSQDPDGLITNPVTQTTDTKVILGVQTTVVHDTVSIAVAGLGTVLLEDTIDLIAWDNDCNVWYFGEDSTAYQYDANWNLIGTTKEGSWQAGVNGAMPGILMLANPRKGDAYQQEFAQGVSEDMGSVLNLGLP